MKNNSPALPVRRARLVSVIFVVFGMSVVFGLSCPRATAWRSCALQSSGAPIRPVNSIADNRVVRPATEDFDAESSGTACSIRAIPYEDEKGRKYPGKHGWSGQGGQGAWAWYSDTANAIKEFSICRYDFDKPTTTVSVAIGAGQIDFKNRDGSGVDGGLMLAVYHEAPPASLFRGKDVTFDKSALGVREWKKKVGQASISIKSEVVRVTFKTPVSKVYLVVVGVDPWIDTSVSITLASLSATSQPPAQSKASRKK